jgi:hypothetical protein
MVGALGSPNQDLRVIAFVTSVPQDSALQIVGFRLPSKVGDAPSVLLRNVSEKQIQSVVLGVVLGSADRPGRADAATKTERLPVVVTDLKLRQTAALAPNTTEEIGEGALGSGALISAAQSYRTTCLHVAVVVTELHFADGTKWELKDFFEKAHQLWKDSIPPSNLSNCRNSSEIEEVFNRMKGAKYIVGTPTHADPRPVPYFSFSCSMSNKEEHPICQI